MQNSLRAVLEHLIDYAGLFPPANLPLAVAVRNYADYQTDKDAWMLGNFIMPASRLDELSPYMSLFSRALPFTCSALGSKSDNKAACLERLRTDLMHIEIFRSKYMDVAKVDVIEFPLPPSLPEPWLLEEIATQTSAHRLYPFCEVTVSRDAAFEQQIFFALDAIAAQNAASRTPLGVKLRTGGVTTDAFLTPMQIATVLTGCRDRKIKLKFTAGLHHPIRMYRGEVGTKMHGFVNVFTAGMLAYTHNLNAQRTAKILSDETPNSFDFCANTLTWQGQTLTVHQIIQLRKTALCSYGSCSFDEPRDDLRQLQFLATEGSIDS